jgi:DNA-binding MarR family transcriptional regulator
MSSSTVTPDTQRAELVERLAEQLPSRAAILVRLLVKQIRFRETSRTEMSVLGILREGPRRITELAELEGTAQPTMTLLVKRLEQKAWVARERVPADGRVALIRITPAGGAAHERFLAEAIAAMRVDLEPLSDREIEDLAAATDALGSFVEDLQRRAGR